MISFKSVPGTTATSNSSLITFDLSGPEDALTKVKEKLTIRNKSVGFQLRKANERVSFFAGLMTKERELYGEPLEKTTENYVKWAGEVQELIPRQQETYFIDHGDYLELPSGLWWMADKVVNDFHVNTDIKPVCLDFLRPYQKEAVVDVLAYKRATCVMATGLGKTAVISSLVVSAVESGKRVFIVVPTEYLVGQVFDSVKRFVKSITAYGGWRKNPEYGADVFVCTAQSAKQFISSYDVVIIDESQHIAAKTWIDILTAAEKGEYVYNFTATPFRGDGLDMAIHAFGGKTVVNLNVRWGIANNWLAKPTVCLLTTDGTDKDGVPVFVSEKSMMATAYKKLVQSHSVMALLKKHVISALSKERRVLVLFKTVSAGLLFRKLMKDTVEFNVASSKNKKPIEDFKEGKCDILVSNDRLLSEGVDIPNIDTLFMVLQNSGEGITYQAVGRALRKAEGKKDVLIIDITVRGYQQFLNAAERRATVYHVITDDVLVY